MWFEKLVGFKEESPDQVRANLIINGDQLKSKINERSFQYGKLEIPNLKELRTQTAALPTPEGKLSISELVADVQALHQAPENQYALFQAASQFNLLEMINPQVSPEDGIDIYDQDFTQGPACAIACGAGTIYRNYFVPLDNQIGQSHTQQVDCLNLIGDYFNNRELQLWQMKNGYAFPSLPGLHSIDQQIKKMDAGERDHLKSLLKIGIQWDTQVTIASNQQLVSQAFCSALPIAYSHLPVHLWEAFARLILEASYEATLQAALINFHQYGSNKVFLTLLGGGAFGNPSDWIMDALQEALGKFSTFPLDIKIVSYGASNPQVQQLINQWKF